MTSKSMFWVTVVLGIYADTFTNMTNLEVFGLVSMGMLVAIAHRIIFEPPVTRSTELSQRLRYSPEATTEAIRNALKESPIKRKGE